jgi:hypothetical protein
VIQKREQKMSADTKSVADLAYELWVARGRPHGSALQDWAEAERQLALRGKAPPPTREAKEQRKIPVAAQDQSPASKTPKQRKIKKASDAPQRRKRPGKSIDEG